ncbi:MAG: hypothetical protein ACSW8H_05455, partial [bacterium]
MRKPAKERPSFFSILKVAEANRLLSSGEVRTVNEAVEKVGIARSSYYKFKYSVEEFHNNLPGSMLTIV